MTEYRLGDICKVINGRAYRQPELLDAGKYPVLRVGNFFRVIDGFILTWNYQRINSVTTAICYLRGLLHLGLEFGTEER